MTGHSIPFRALALFVLVVVAGVILIAFLIVAATRDSRSSAAETRVVWIACTDVRCDPVASPFADLTPLASVEGP